LTLPLPLLLLLVCVVESHRHCYHALPACLLPLLVCVVENHHHCCHALPACLLLLPLLLLLLLLVCVVENHRHCCHVGASSHRWLLPHLHPALTIHCHLLISGRNSVTAIVPGATCNKEQYSDICCWSLVYRATWLSKAKKLFVRDM
jgi:hypothetical protein